MEQSQLHFSLWAATAGFTPYERINVERLLLDLFPSPPREAEDVLVPPFSSRERKSTMTIAIFNLVSTMVGGGGALALPRVFQRCGVAWATVGMVIFAFLTDRSLYLLCMCARSAGAKSYGETGFIACGLWMQKTISSCIFLSLVLILVAYMSLIKDIWAPLVQMMVLPNAQGPWVLLGCLVLVSPFYAQRELRTLRFNSFAGVAGVMLLCAALCFLAATPSYFEESDGDDNETSPDNDNSERSDETDSYGDFLATISILSVNFLSAFNILPIQCELEQPTKHRVRVVIRLAVCISFSLLYVIGLAGYLFAGDETYNNILNNLDGRSSDFVVVLGRVGVGVSILLSTAVMLQPCRSNLLEVVQKVLNHEDRMVCDTVTEICPESCCEFEEDDEETAPTATSQSTTEQTSNVFFHEGSALLPPIEEVDEEQQNRRRYIISKNPNVYYGSTVGIVALCYLVAIVFPGTSGILWNSVMASMSFLLAFFFPATCYLRVIGRQPQNSSCHVWAAFSWTILTNALIATLLCIVHSTLPVVRQAAFIAQFGLAFLCGDFQR